jgi:hypothetical protein
MKKIAIFFVSLILLFCLAFGAHAALVTTTPQESTTASDAQSGDGMIYDVDTTLPVAACIVAVGAFIVYGIVKIKKANGEK